MRFTPLPAALAAALLLSPCAALAGSLQVGPVSLGMIGQERTTTLTVRNTGAAPVNLQVRTVDWTQAGGEDVYNASRTLVASPPSFSLQPGQAQTVRVVVRGVANTQTEKAWRLIVDELPSAPGAGGSGVVVPVRVLVPVFLGPSTQARPKLAWSAARAGDGLRLDVSNTGPVHERLTGLTVKAGDAPVNGADPLVGYVLSGATRSWTLPAGGRAQAVVAEGAGAFGPVKAELSVSN